MPCVQRAIIVVGHGSLRPTAGAAMVHLAAQAQALGLAPRVTAAFLNYNQPTLTMALANCVAAGARDIIVQPYFLIPGKFVSDDLVRQIATAQAAYPSLSLHLAAPFGDHPALARLLLQRAQEAELAARSAADLALTHCSQQRSGLLIMAHGSRQPQSNAPIYRVARRVRARGRYAAVYVCFMELNQPSIDRAISRMIAQGIERILAVPFFLQLGNHMLDDLPAALELARTRHPHSTILMAEHLAYDPLLLEVIADRVAAVMAAS